jgi:hypothetical protein
MSAASKQPWLNAVQRRMIDSLSQRQPLNLAPPPKSLEDTTIRAGKFISLTAFIEDSDWDYAALDIVDRLEIRSFSIEDFWRAKHYCCSADRLRSFSKMGWSARIRGMVTAAVNAAATIPTVRLE